MEALASVDGKEHLNALARLETGATDLEGSRVGHGERRTLLLHGRAGSRAGCGQEAEPHGKGCSPHVFEYASGVLGCCRGGLGEHAAKELARRGLLDFGDLLRSPDGDHLSPCLSPSGPRSTIQSACLITSRLCSITSTVFPESTSR